MASNWVEETVNNTGFTLNDSEIVNPTPPAWGQQDPTVGNTSLLLSGGWTVGVNATLLDLTFNYNDVPFFSINDNGSIGLLQHTDLPSNADIGSIAMKGADLYIYKGV